MSSLDELRKRLARYYSCSNVAFSRGVRVHSATFQPLASRQNQDRLVVQRYHIRGQEWLVLAVCDGHGGASTARHTASHLPNRLRATIERTLSVGWRGKLDRENMLKKSANVTAELRRCVREFDRELGEVVRTVCPDPTALTENQTRGIVLEYGDVLWRACAGTTLAATIVNVDYRLMWAINVGDSTVALSTADANGKRWVHEPCALHVLTNPRERKRILRKHPGEPHVIRGGRILSDLSMSRSIGDYAYKLDASYSTNLFRHLTMYGIPPLSRKITKNILTPPYITADPSVRFIDLQPIWDQHPVIMVYSNGIDNLVRGCSYLHPHRPTDIVASRAISVLLQDEVDESVGDVLGHEVDPHWSGAIGNRAVDVLGNLAAGTSVQKLQLLMHQPLLSDRSTSPRLYVDDTTLVLCFLRTDTPS
ncbi:protein serine/threonine phosphatase 2C [Epithele typhae]|uniref:protein serine/threonine phosphatase 2C n=1 Tax=Epithele typhae TaxID=378194 RepID=UPI00200764DF|nr:protein serine/threonine phosphatase 2C [Epithele typhae]KAH9945334.1 protein serine/threonine phosphatase 2C [Epithele typhae]